MLSKIFGSGMVLCGIAAIVCSARAVYIGETGGEWFDPTLLQNQKWGLEFFVACAAFFIPTILTIR